AHADDLGAAGNPRRGPLPVRAKRAAEERRCAEAVERFRGVQRLRARDVAIPGRQTPVTAWIHREACGIRVQPATSVVEAGAILVGLAAVEPRRLETGAPGEQPRGDDP